MVSCKKDSIDIVASYKRWDSIDVSVGVFKTILIDRVADDSIIELMKMLKNTNCEIIKDECGNYYIEVPNDINTIYLIKPGIVIVICYTINDSEVTVFDNIEQYEKIYRPITRINTNTF